MNKEQEARYENYEKMHEAIREGYKDVEVRMGQLKKQGKIPTSNYKQLMGQKAAYKNMLDMYKLFDLD